MTTYWLVHESRASYLWTRPAKKARSAVKIVTCWLRGHQWHDWRIETEDWFDQPVPPQPHAWRMCGRCRLIQTVLKRLGPSSDWIDAGTALTDAITQELRRA